MLSNRPSRPRIRKLLHPFAHLVTMMIVIVGAALAKEETALFLCPLLRHVISDTKIAVDFIACDSEFSPTTTESKRKTDSVDC